MKQVSLGRIAFVGTVAGVFERQQWNPSLMNAVDRKLIAKSLYEIAIHLASGRFLDKGKYKKFSGKKKAK